MEFYDVVEERRSKRRYTNTSIEKEKLYRVLESATLVPTWSCKDCWKLIILDDVEIKNKIAECVNRANPARDSIFQAPITVIVCADPMSTEEIDEKEYYMADCGIVMEHIMLACTNENLATCWIGIFDEDKIKATLGIPERYRIVALSPIGYGEDKSEQKRKKGIKDITYHNKWDNELVFK